MRALHCRRRLQLWVRRCTWGARNLPKGISLRRSSVVAAGMFVGAAFLGLHMVSWVGASLPAFFQGCLPSQRLTYLSGGAVWFPYTPGHDTLNHGEAPAWVRVDRAQGLCTVLQWRVWSHAMIWYDYTSCTSCNPLQVSMIASYMPTGDLPGLGRVSGTAVSFTDLLLGFVLAASNTVAGAGTRWGKNPCCPTQCVGPGV